MRIGMVCANCGGTYSQEEDEVALLIDFREQKITFRCRNCKHENALDLSNWKKQQKHSPLPRPIMGKF